MTILLAFLACLGFCIGILAGLVGIGGALLTVPTLLYIYPVLFPHAHPFSMAAITDVTAMQTFAAGLSSVRVHWRQKNLNIPLVIAIGASSMAGGFIGGLTTHWYDNHLLKILFALLMIFVAYILIKKNISLEVEREIEIGKDVTPTIANTQSSPLTKRVLTKKDAPITLISLFTGYLSGLLGVGGAVFVMPIFSNWLGMPIRLAIGCTTGVITMTCIASLIGKMQSHDFPLLEASIISFGALFGANIGAKLSFKVQEKWLLMLFLLIVILTLLRIGIELLFGY